MKERIVIGRFGESLNEGRTEKGGKSERKGKERNRNLGVIIVNVFLVIQSIQLLRFIQLNWSEPFWHGIFVHGA